MKNCYAALVLVFTLCSGAFAQSNLVRLDVVNVPVDSGLLASILPEFESTTGYRVQVDKRGDEAYDVARLGQADLVISHYGHVGVEAFMADGLGLWPRAVFANQSVIVGPASDPAGIRGTQDAVEAFRRIAQTQSKFLVNNAATEKYLGQTLWDAAGRPDPGAWLINAGLRDQPVIQAAERMGGYVLWGVIPFLKFKEATQSKLEALVLDDPLFQRMMVSIVVNPEKIPGVNVAGALALQKYLGSSAAQAKIRAFRYPGIDHPLFWPGARDNSGSFLGDLEGPVPTASQAVATTLAFRQTTIRPGGSLGATITGANLTADTFFDVRFQAPGGGDQIATNWQRGVTGDHTTSASTPPGTWRVTGIRAHVDPNDHTGAFIPVAVALTVQP